MCLDVKQKSVVGLGPGEHDLGLVLEKQRFSCRGETAEGHVAEVEGRKLKIFTIKKSSRLYFSRSVYSVVCAEVPCPSQTGTELCHVQEPDVLDDERRASEVSGNGGGPLRSETS